MSTGIVTQLLVGGVAGSFAGGITGAAVVLGTRRRASRLVSGKAFRPPSKTACRGTRDQRYGMEHRRGHTSSTAPAVGEDPESRAPLDAALREHATLREQQVSAYADQLAAGDVELRDHLRRFERRS